MFKKTAFFAVLMSLIFVMVSFAAEDVRIGLVTPLTGDVATFGESTRNAAVLWAEEVNAKGGLLGGKVVLAIEDDRNIPAETANAVQKLISQNKVVAVVGSVASKCTLAGAPIAQAAKVPMISPTSTNEAVTKVGDYIFRACFIDPFQGTVMAKFAYTKLNARNAAMLYDIGNDYTKGLAENFKKAFEALGGKIVASETYGVGESDFSAQLTKIRSARPDVLFLPDYYNSVGLQAKQARQLGITATFLGGDGWDSSELVPIGGSAIEGGMFSNHYAPGSSDPVAKNFYDNYVKKFGAPPDALAALAYDACLIVGEAITKAGKLDKTAIRDAMAATKDLHAVSGVLTFDANRNPIKSAVILEVKGGKFVYRDTVNP
ncbi:MAG TPA: ABC transporter substrate-binding protein [Bacillota bacterium]|nr:ABC transporter substrate-binding protein [Bacillota bacterium]HOA14753.1 ABC transporter substrate-binding protein [Bacillota bacterium]